MHLKVNTAPVVLQGQPWLHPRANRQIEIIHTDGQRLSIAYLYEVAARKSIGLSISPEGLRVRAPRWVSQKSIDSCVREKSHWIIQKLQLYTGEKKSANSPAIHWQHGCVFDYMGQKVQLSLGYAARTPLLQMAMASSEEKADQEPLGVLHVPLPLTARAAQVERYMRQWLRAQALLTVQQRMSIWAPIMGVQPTRLSLTSARTRWGSASSSGAIRLHWRLIQMPLPILDYVVIHELAHLHEMNHSARFWSWVEKTMPDYAHWRALLKSISLPEWH